MSRPPGACSHVLHARRYRWPTVYHNQAMTNWSHFSVVISLASPWRIPCTVCRSIGYVDVRRSLPPTVLIVDAVSGLITSYPQEENERVEELDSVLQELFDYSRVVFPLLPTAGGSDASVTVLDCGCGSGVWIDRLLNEATVECEVSIFLRFSRKACWAPRLQAGNGSSRRS